MDNHTHLYINHSQTVSVWHTNNEHNHRHQCDDCWARSICECWDSTDYGAPVGRQTNPEPQLQAAFRREYSPTYAWNKQHQQVNKIKLAEAPQNPPTLSTGYPFRPCQHTSHVHSRGWRCAKADTKKLATRNPYFWVTLCGFLPGCHIYLKNIEAHGPRFSGSFGGQCHFQKWNI